MILTTMNLQISSDTFYTAKYINSVKKKETAYYAGKSAVDSVRDYVKKGYSSDPKELYDYLKYIESTPLNLNTGDVKVSIEIQDLEKKFSINSIENNDNLEYLKRIFTEIGLSSSNIPKIADWIDKDDNSRVDGNEYSLKYGTVKNAPIDSLNELNWIDSFKDDIKDFKENKVEGAGNLENYLTSYGLSYNKININTASRVLLKSLTDDLTEQEVDEIIKNRPITDKNDFINKHILDPDKIYNIEKVAGYKSEYFEIKATAVYDEETLIIKTVVDKDGKILFWGVE